MSAAHLEEALPLPWQTSMTHSPFWTKSAGHCSLCLHTSIAYCLHAADVHTRYMLQGPSLHICMSAGYVRLQHERLETLVRVLVGLHVCGYRNYVFVICEQNHGNRSVHKPDIAAPAVHCCATQHLRHQAALQSTTIIMCKLKRCTAICFPKDCNGLQAGTSGTR